MQVCSLMCAHADHRLTIGIFINSFPPDFLRQGISKTGLLFIVHQHCTQVLESELCAPPCPVLSLHPSAGVRAVCFPMTSPVSAPKCWSQSRELLHDQPCLCIQSKWWSQSCVLSYAQLLQSSVSALNPWGHRCVLPHTQSSLCIQALGSQVCAPPCPALSLHASAGDSVCSPMPSPVSAFKCWSQRCVLPHAQLFLNTVSALKHWGHRCVLPHAQSSLCTQVLGSQVCALHALSILCIQVLGSQACAPSWLALSLHSSAGVTGVCSPMASC